MAYEFADRVVIVTGAGSGLGRGYAHYLAKRGARVLVNSLVPDDVDKNAPTPAAAVCAEIAAAGGVASHNDLSVAAPDTGKRLVEQAMDLWGRVDAVINNAGNVVAGHFEDLSDNMVTDVLNTHFMGSMRLARAAWPYMKTRRYGRIVNTSSDTIFGVPYNLPYIASKGALIGLTKALAVEGAPAGIRVNAVVPTAYTRLTAGIPDENFRQALQTLFPPEKVAPLVAWLCHDRCDCSGELLAAGGGRVARLFLGLTGGAVLGTDEIGSVAAQRAEIFDGKDHIVPVDTTDTVVLAFEKITGMAVEKPNLSETTEFKRM